MYLTKPEQNLTQYLIFVAISNVLCMEGEKTKNPPSMLSAIKARMSKGTRISTAVAVETHEL